MSLFAGVGGIDLGLEAAGRSLGIPVEIVAQAEINRHSQAVLRRHLRIAQWVVVKTTADVMSEEQR